MYELSGEHHLAKMIFDASIHGIDLEKELRKQGIDINKNRRKPLDDFMFQAPEAYAHLTQEEKEELTKKMMSRHMNFFAGGGPHNKHFGMNYHKTKNKGIGVG